MVKKLFLLLFDQFFHRVQMFFESGSPPFRNFVARVWLAIYKRLAD